MAATSDLSAERLPITSFTNAGPLTHGRITRFFQDSHGFIWVCTADGLSRFDGEAFEHYGTKDGLPHPSVTSMLELGSDYWLSTNGGGVVRFASAPAPHAGGGQSSFGISVFKVGSTATTQRVNFIYSDRRGSIWAGTDGGLFRRTAASADAGFVRVPLNLRAQPDEVVQIWEMTEDEDGTLWIASRFGLLRLGQDGQVVQYNIQPEGNNDHVWALLQHDGRLWLGHNSGLIVLRPPKSSGGADHAFHIRDAVRVDGRFTLPDVPGEAYRYQPLGPLPAIRILSISAAASGSVWMGSRGGGLVEYRDGRFNVYTRAHGLTDLFVQTAQEDRGGSLWLGTNSGVLRVARGGFISYGESDGLGPHIGWMFESGDAVYATSLEFLISRFDGRRFETVKPRLPPAATGWRSRGILRDRNGEWWIGTRQGVFRFPRVNRFDDLDDVEPVAAYTVREGLAADDVATFFEDRRGDIWMGHFAAGDEVLTRWERSTKTFHRYAQRDGLRPLLLATAFVEDSAGGLWIGFRDGEVMRYDGQRFIQEVPPDSEPERRVTSMVRDARGLLWMSIQGRGLLRVDPQQTGPQRLRLFTTADGFASNDVGALAFDGRDRLYAAVGRAFGIDVLDLRTHHIRHLTPSDGTPNSEIGDAYCDRYGTVWLSTTTGLFRFAPTEERQTALPQTRIGRLSIDGAPVYVPPLGASDLGAFELAPGRNRLEISFFGLTPTLDGGVRYQYRLEGAEDEWSSPTAQRVVTFASLAPGEYRFVVRAIGGDGRVSESPATVAVTVPRPVWQRWWFVSLAVLAASALAYGVHRARVARLIDLERVRMRIATDLHDDIGSGLSQVAVLTELLGRRVGTDTRVVEPLATIGELSRNLVDSMNDIVWAINPKRDHVSDLTHRMRRFASEVLGGRDIAFEFSAQENDSDLALGPDVRREVWLIFKESVNNIVRHARCSQVQIIFAAQPDALRLTIRDNGVGCDPAARGDGNGLSSMEQRATRLGSTLTVTSQKGQGTTITLLVPLGRRRRWLARS